MIEDLDRDIISFLQYDGRMPFTKIAAEPGIAEGAVRRRVRQLTDSGTLQVVAVAEPLDLGRTDAARIGISVKSNLITPAADEIARLPEVSYLFQAAGKFVFLPKSIAQIGRISSPSSIINCSKYPVWSGLCPA
jgi:Lrp/AsnC family transcriptional regulator for asnA, asnC and gidA